MQRYTSNVGYNFPDGRSFYRPSSRAQVARVLRAELGTVEINYPFYRMPSEKTIAGWNAATLEDHLRSEGAAAHHGFGACETSTNRSASSLI